MMVRLKHFAVVVMLGTSASLFVGCHEGSELDPWAVATCSGHGRPVQGDDGQWACACDEGYRPEGY